MGTRANMSTSTRKVHDDDQPRREVIDDPQVLRDMRCIFTDTKTCSNYFKVYTACQCYITQ